MSLTDDKKKLLELLLKKKGVAVKSDSGQSIPLVDRSKPLELSYGQQQLWFLENLESGTPAYVFCNAIKLSGELNSNAIEHSINRIIERHEILRTVYDSHEGKPFQRILPHQYEKLDILDLSELNEQDKDRKIKFEAETEAKQPFDIRTQKCIRYKLLKVSDNEHILLLTMHHIVFDGWSLGVLFNELSKHYSDYLQDAKSVAPLTIQYADYASWQRNYLNSGELDRQLGYWTEQLQGDLPVLTLPSDRPRPAVQSFNGNLHFFEIDSDLTNALKFIAKKHECTLFMVLLSAYYILLNRYTGQEDLLVGSPIASRNHADIESLIGFFVNTLVLRANLSGELEYSALLNQLRRTTMDAYAHQDVPFEILVEKLKPERDLSYNPIYQVMFALQNTPPPSSEFSGLNMSLQEIDSGTALFDITLNMWEENGRLKGYFEYNTDLFDESTIIRMTGHYCNILSSVANNYDIKLNEISLLGAHESRMLIEEWNDTDLEPVSYTSICQLFDQEANTNPDSIAIVHKSQSISYGELKEKSEKVASILIDKNESTSPFVGICLERSIDMFIGIMGVLKAGYAYAPIDPSYPKDRIEHIINDAGLSIILTSTDKKESLPAFDPDNLITLDNMDYLNNEAINDTLQNTENPAYIIYTSGSTGLPKGVPITHKNLLHSTISRINYYADKVSAFMLLSSFSFDSSVAGIFWTLCTGGKLVLPAQGEEKDIVALKSLICENNVSHLLCLPSLYNVLLSEASQDEISALKAVIVAGEACPAELVAKHFAKLSSTRLYNEYGPTEGTVWSTVYKTDPDLKLPSIPIGKPIPYMMTYILDKNYNLCPIGVPGELYIAGAGVSSGYHNKDELTRQKFLPNPYSTKYPVMYRTGDMVRYLPDGNIEFLGRIDNQVKVRGFRIELSEIESVISRYPDINEVLVVTRDIDMGEEQDISIDQLFETIDVDSARRIIQKVSGAYSG